MEFANTPLFHPGQKALTYPLYNAHKYCKMSLSGGLAQLVEQRTLNPFVASSTLASPTNHSKDLKGLSSFKST